MHNHRKIAEAHDYSHVSVLSDFDILIVDQAHTNAAARITAAAQNARLGMCAAFATIITRFVHCQRHVKQHVQNLGTSPVFFCD